jgi:hypothetical protein
VLGDDEQRISVTHVGQPEGEPLTGSAARNREQEDVAVSGPYNGERSRAAMRGLMARSTRRSGTRDNDDHRRPRPRRRRG